MTDNPVVRPMLSPATKRASPQIMLTIPAGLLAALDAKLEPWGHGLRSAAIREALESWLASPASDRPSLGGRLVWPQNLTPPTP